MSERARHGRRGGSRPVARPGSRPAAPLASDPVETTVERLGAAGDGVAPGPLYVPGALPGELVRAQPVRPHGDGTMALLRAVLRESAERVSPPCPHFNQCGGCTLQHWADAPYANWQSHRLGEALERAGFASPMLGALARTPPGARRRADLALRRQADGAVSLGFFDRGSDAVANLSTCLVLDPRLVALFEPLRALLRGMRSLRRDGSAVLNLLDSGPDLLLRTDGVLDASERTMLAEFARRHGFPRIAWALKDGPAEIAAQLGPVALAFGAAIVAPPPGAFLQASPHGEAAIRDAVLAGLPDKLPVRAKFADLYAGLGTLSFPLAERGAVTAFEGVAESVAAMAATAGRAGGRVRAVRRDLARQPLLPAELDQFAAVVLDPPYAGAAEQVSAITRSSLRRLVYVSCNPAALTRDARALRAAGWALLRATPIDQFLWSPHLEAVAVFARAR